MKVIAFGAHPDDIEVGMGGTIAKYAGRGHDVLMVVATVPSGRESRITEAGRAAKILGADLRILDLNPEDLMFSRRLVNLFSDVVSDFKPDVMYTHWNHDSHQDHVYVSEAGIAAARRNNFSVYMYEQTIPGGIVPYGFRPQSFVDISDTIKLKVRSVLAHKTQVKTNGRWWVYGIEGRAMYRGYQINAKYAEAFEVVKEIKTI